MSGAAPCAETDAGNPRRRPTAWKVVTSVVAVLLGVAVVKEATRMRSCPGSSEDVAAMALRNVACAIDAYKATHRTLPPSLEALTRPPNPSEAPAPSVAADDEPAPWIERIPLDPWGAPYAYRITDERRNRYELRSAGEDGRLGTADDVVETGR